MSIDLIMLCASADSRNVAEIVEELSYDWNLIGFLDDDPAKQGTIINGIPVLGKTADAVMYPTCNFVILVGSAKDYSLKKRLFNRLSINLEQFATIIHPNAYVSKFASVGRDVAILSGVTVMANAVIGNHVFIASKSNIGHDTKIGDYVLMSALVAIPGNVIVEEGCYIGLNSSIRDGVIIGKWSLVGMGSVVIHNVPPYHVVAGNPAKIIKELDPANFEFRNFGK